MIILILIIIILLILLSYQHFTDTTLFNEYHLLKDDIAFKDLKTDKIEMNTSLLTTTTNYNNLVDLVYPIGSCYCCDIEKGMSIDKLTKQFPGTSWKLIDNSTGKLMMTNINNSGLFEWYDISINGGTRTSMGTSIKTREPSDNYKQNDIIQLENLPYHTHQYDFYNSKQIEDAYDMPNRQNAIDELIKNKVSLPMHLISKDIETDTVGENKNYIPKYINILVYQRIS